MQHQATIKETESPENFYQKLKPGLYRRIGRHLRLAGRIVDMGCGDCELAQYLAKAYNQHITGVDTSGVSFPNKKHHSVRCLKRDAGRLDNIKSEQIDAVVTTLALHEMDDPPRVFEEAYRILRPGAEVLVVDFARDSIAQELWNEDYYRPDDVKQLLIQAGFRNVRSSYHENKQLIWATGFRKPAITYKTKEQE